MTKPIYDKDVPCWGPMGLWRNERTGCKARLPSTDHAVMRRLGWGFTKGPNENNPPDVFYACPEHKDVEE